MRRWVGLAVVVLASTLLLTAGASPGSAATGRAYVANYGSDTVSVVDLATHTLATTIAVGDGPVDVAVTPNGTRAYVANYHAGTVSVIDTASDTVVATVSVTLSHPQSVTITPDGRQAWITGSIEGIRIIDLASNTIVSEVPTVPYARDVAFSPDGTRAYVVADSLQVVDTATHDVLGHLPAGHGNIDVEVSGDGARVYVLDAVGYVLSNDTATNANFRFAQFRSLTKDLAVSPDGARLYLTRQDPPSLLVLDSATLAVVATVPFDFAPWGVDVSPAGDRVYVSGGGPGNQGRLVAVDTATNSVASTVAVGVDPRGLAVSPSTSSPPPPPPAPVIEGATFYTDGTSARSGVAPGARIAVFTSSGVPGVAYRLVLSRDGCRSVLAVLNANSRFANASGVIGSTGGTIPPGTPGGRYHVCFRALVGNGTTITAPVTLDVA